MNEQRKMVSSAYPKTVRTENGVMSIPKNSECEQQKRVSSEDKA